MRVVEFRALTAAASSAGLPTRMDDFAVLPSDRATDPAIGGFRILRPRHAKLTRVRARALRRRASARLRATGFLSVLFVGGLGLAVLAGPASCPCDHPRTDAAPLAASPDAQLLSRLAYTRASAIGIPSGAQADADTDVAGLGRGGGNALPKLAALIEPYEPMGTSPISTSAIPPPGNDPAHGGYALPARIGALPAKIEELADAAPKPIRLAAATPAEGEIVPMLPMGVIATPDPPEVIPVETDPQSATEDKARPKHAASKRRGSGSLRARKARVHAAPGSAAPKIVRAPRWAQQMFETPWQSTAFSYVR